MNQWSNIYRHDIAKFGSVRNFVLHRINYKKRLVKAIYKYANRSGRILEIGCGSGASLAFLGLLGYWVSGIDSDHDMIKIVKEITSFFKNRVDLRTGDLMKIPDDMGSFDLIFSNGALEHFPDDKIAKIIEHCLSMSRTLIFSIPTDYFSDEQKIYGDERFLSVKYWKKIIKTSNVKCLESFGFYFENKFIETIYNLIGGSFPIKPPFIGFVLRN